MDSWLTASLLGIVEGLTEFLPVSSTGHLIITGHLLGFTGPKAATFEIFIQLGAILAVVVLYWPRFLGLISPPRDAQGQQPAFSGMRGILLLMLTSLPASVVGLMTHSYIKAHLFGPRTVALALFAGAVMILVVEALPRKSGTRTLDEISPALAVGIGCFQCLALWPGFSRSAATIMGGMILGADRRLAAEYSFIAAVPIMVAATFYDLIKSASALTGNDFFFLAVGFVVSFFSAWAAVKVFIRLLKRFTLRPFAWYRLAVAPLVYFIWS